MALQNSFLTSIDFMSIFNGYEDSVFRLFVAALLGGIIGLERDIHGRSAGLRTHMLVCLGSALFMIISNQIALLVPKGTLFADPGRIAAQIVTGIGFLGAGVIIKDRGGVRGLTTAACMWIVAAVGMAAGSGLFGIALVGTALAVVSLMFLKPIENVYRKHAYRTLRISTNLETDATQLIGVINKQDVSIVACDISRDYGAETTQIVLTLRLLHKGVTDKLAHGVIKDLESSGIPLQTVYWSR